MVRCMPNTPVVVRNGVTVYSSNGSVGEEDKELVEHMLDSVELEVEMPEHYMDIITGLTGCGPSYVSIYVTDQLKTWPVLKPSDGFKAGQTASKRARRLRNGPDGFLT